MTMLRCLAIDLAVAMIALQAHKYIRSCLAQRQGHLERPRHASPKDGLEGTAGLIITVSLRQCRRVCSMRSKAVRASTRARSRFCEGRETDADSHMLTPRAISLMGDEHGDFWGIDLDWAYSDLMSYVRHTGV